MTSGNYAGVEIPSIVLDLGSDTTRIGHAGEDCPRSMFPTNLGKRIGDFIPGTDGGFSSSNNKHNYIGGIGNTVNHISGVEMVNPFSEGEIVDYDAFESVCSYAFNHSLRLGSNEQPLLFTEYSWASLNQREKVTELMFETFDIPALYLARNAVLSAFASGRTTALVLDSGACMTSAVPVYDGYVLKKGIFKQPLGGNDINEYIIEDLKKLYNYEVTPSYLIKNRQILEAEALPQLELKQFENTTESFNKFMKLNAVNEFKESTCQIFESFYNQNAIDTRPGKPYEFSDGYNRIFGSERFRYGEIMFQPNLLTNHKKDMNSISKLIVDSINLMDVDLKPHLCHNIILSGGNTLINGFNDRLGYELNSQLYGQRIKLIHGPNNFERKYTNWLGGSILSSLATFNQLWLSKSEYQESGTSIIEKKFA
ncbi:Actin/actin-like protein [Neoconidiobolus thromboides FSU 785]|nr:Actin/actin-like protein [Neoconidiobolus thromboides FSU 785]